MKFSKKAIFIYIFSIFFIVSFLIPSTTAQEWIYDGVDTEHIPNFSVYPTEVLFYNYTGVGDDPELLGVFEIVKGNITDIGGGNGTGVWCDLGQYNITSGETTINLPNTVAAWWNETVGYYSLGFPFIIPVEDNGKVSSAILGNVSVYMWSMITPYNFEHQQIYPNLYSIRYWNTTINNAFIKLNYTDDGIITAWHSYDIGFGNYTLHSQPAQLAPVFSFTTENGTLSLNTTEFKLNITITDADNNNDGIVDTDYEYRIQNGSTWSTWASVPNQLDWDLGSVSSGDYDITMEVKNMYAVSSDVITIDYTAPDEDGDGDGDGDGGGGEIPSFPIAIISIVAIFSVSIIILKLRKKLKI